MFCVSLALAALAPTAIQVPREPVLLGGPLQTLGGAAVVASSEDFSAASWVHANGQDVLLATSDGRGVAWSAPVVVDGAPVGTQVPFPRLAVVEEHAFVLWSDKRFSDPALAPFSASTPFLRVFDAGAGLGAEVQIPTGTIIAHTRVVERAIEAVRVGSELRVHVGLYLLLLDPVTGFQDSQVVLVTSYDGGQTFGQPVALTAPFLPTPGGLVVRAEGAVVHVFWTGRDGATFGSQQVYHQRSSDGGLTLDFAPEQTLGGGEFISGLHADSDGATVAAGWLAFNSVVPGQFLLSRVSTDGGTSFGPPTFLGPPDPASESVQHATVVVRPVAQDVVAAWSEGTLGTPDQRVLTARTTDGGATWSPPQQLSTVRGAFPALRAAGAGSERVVAAWIEDVSPKHVAASVSRDGGTTWGAPVQVSPDPTTFFRLAYNDRYDNVLATWGTDPSLTTLGMFAGGLRPQTLTPTGFVPGPTQIGATFEAFDDGLSVAWFVVSTAPGDLLLPFGDGRNFGLGFSPLFLASVDLALLGPLATTLAPDGSGALAPLSVNLPSPLTLYAVGLAIDGSTPGFGQVSDVVRIDL